MCGIAGLVGMGSAPGWDLGSVALAMAGRMAERGPDAEGSWVDGLAGVALSHRRLAVVDLSPTGAQPMVSRDERFVVAFNGEIYNHGKLRSRLIADGITLRGTSDTEVLVEGISAWGIDEVLSASVGMFAFASWDRKEQQLVLARDRFGEKPLYWGRLGNVLAFASTLGALEAVPEFPTTVDTHALRAYFANGYIPAPMSIWKGVSKLSPGHCLRWKQGQTAPEIACYWNPRVVEHESRSAMIVDPREAADLVHQSLRRSVAEQMVADVPVGCFLSGGIDSSLIAAIAAEQHPGRVDTFTVSFDEKGFDESVHAQAVADHLGTRHHVTSVGPADVLAVVPKLREWYGEPFADSSQVPTALLCQWARKHVTVALSGDGADELFAGYTRYAHTQKAMRLLRRMPTWSRKLIAAMGNSVPGSVWSTILWPVDRLTGRRSLENSFSQKVIKGFGLLRCRNQADVYRGIMMRPQVPGLLEALGETASITEGEEEGLQALRWMLRQDQLDYLPGDVLTKVDRSAMAFSLETRAPFLDHRTAELAWRIQPSHLMTGGRGKIALRSVLARYVPESLFDRPKMGFAMPMDVWLAGPLRDWAENLFSASALESAPWLNRHIAQKLWVRFLAGETHLRYLIWDILMLVSWSSERRAQVN